MKLLAVWENDEVETLAEDDEEEEDDGEEGAGFDLGGWWCGLQLWKCGCSWDADGGWFRSEESRLLWCAARVAQGLWREAPGGKLGRLGCSQRYWTVMKSRRCYW